MSTPHVTHNLDTPEKKERFLGRLAQVVLEVQTAWPLVETEAPSSETPSSSDPTIPTPGSEVLTEPPSPRESGPDSSSQCR